MGLGGALNIGRSALQSYQTAIEVTGNNLANVATTGYHRQKVTLTPNSDQEIQTGVFVGRGVQISSILRQVDTALEGRLRNAISDESGAQQRLSNLSQIESLENELSDQDLSTQLGNFFNAFSELANSPQDNSQRALVVQQGASLAGYLRDLRGGLTDLRNQTDQTLDQTVASVNDLLQQIQDVNAKLVQADGGTGGANSLRDQRDDLLAQLSQYLNFTLVEDDSGTANVYVNSLPLVLAGQSRGLALKRTTDADGNTQIDLTIAADGSTIHPTEGKLGALITSRSDDIVQAISDLDNFTNALIYQVNLVHSQGQGTQGYTSLTSSNAVSDADAALNSAAAGLKFTPTHGALEINVTQKSTGLREVSTIQIDLDGIDPSNDTSLNSLAAQINANVGHVTATVGGDGKLTLATDSGDYEITFGNDTSGVLATLGLNTFFSGDSALNVDVNSVVQNNSAYLATGLNHVSGDNGTALALAGLADQSIDSLGGLTLTETWNRHVENFAVKQGQAQTGLNSATLVKQNLESQQQSVSGVNTDDEAINLLTYQRAYQASARFLSTVDQMYQTLLQLL